jgi:molybdopterin molybdotransferase
MQGKLERRRKVITAHEARQIILEHARPLEEEEAPLPEALHRLVTRPLAAPIDLPPFANSAMDGFAVRSQETRSAGAENPVSLKIVATVAAGDSPGRIATGEACRIMTGAPIPEGADAVVPFEECRWNDSSCTVGHPLCAGDNVRRRGEDVAKGASLFVAGERVTPRAIALLAALGFGTVPVRRRPRVCLLSTGSELVPAGETLKPGQIYNSNGPALAAALREIGIEPTSLGVASDREDELRRVLGGSDRTPLKTADVLLTVGGVSAGDFDLVPKILRSLGAEIVFHKVAIKPGKPLLYAIQREGRTRGSPLHIFALPGNPVSSLTVFDRFVRPALLKMMGAEKPFRPSHEAVATEALTGAPGKEVYLRGLVTFEDGRFLARSAGAQGSAMLGSLSRANAVLVVPATKPAIKPGEALTFEFLEERP